MDTHYIFIVFFGNIFIIFNCFSHTRAADYPHLKFEKYSKGFTINAAPFSITIVDTVNECFAKCVRHRNICGYLVLEKTAIWKCTLFSLIKNLAEYLIPAEDKELTLYKVVFDIIYCQTWRDHGNTESGVYDLVQQGQKYKAYCEMSGTDEGWTLINRRLNGTVDFDQDWSQYKQGNFNTVFSHL